MATEEDVRLAAVVLATAANDLREHLRSVDQALERAGTIAITRTNATEGRRTPDGELILTRDQERCLRGAIEILSPARRLPPDGAHDARRDAVAWADMLLRVALDVPIGTNKPAAEGLV